MSQHTHEEMSFDIIKTIKKIERYELVEQVYGNEYRPALDLAYKFLDYKREEHEAFEEMKLIKERLTAIEARFKRNGALASQSLEVAEQLLPDHETFASVLEQGKTGKTYVLPGESK